MKRCAYCTSENRDEAIFCRRCRRPLQPIQTRKDHFSRNTFLWILVGGTLILLSSFFFSSRSSQLSLDGPTATPTSTPVSRWMPLTGQAPTQTGEPDTVSACVRNRDVHIRRGPGTDYETTGGLLPGTCLTILGRTEDASWVYMVSQDHKTGWVAVSALPKLRDISRVAIRDHTARVNYTHPTLTSEEIAHGAQVYLTNVAATNIPDSPLSRYVVPCFETANRLGDHVSCRMERAYCDYLPAAEGSSTFCSDRPYPDYTFALVVL